jgi:t-SNARE complex subunit (syntaxin)
VIAETDDLTAAIQVIAAQQETIRRLTSQVEALQRDVERYHEHVARALAYASRDS